MKVAVIGSGGREHALAYKLSESPTLKNLYIIPGNPGTEILGENINIDVKDHRAIISFCDENKIDFVVIGPEQPLVDGLSDMLREKDYIVFGPQSSAARIEGDKAFAKDLMRKYNIPTANYKAFNINERESALKYLMQINYPVVLKASGLAAGKGVIICKSIEESTRAINEMMVDRVFGAAGEEVVIEEFLVGEEASIFAITDGDEYVLLPAAQDHKRIFDGDKGKNTGGMGAYSPAPLITSELLNEIEREIIQPTLNALKSENKTYSGCLYCGLMITSDGPKVVEFNCRFGDPETQAVLPLLEGDFLKLLYSAASGKIDKYAVKYSGGSSVCVVAASAGYPGAYKKGEEIIGLDENLDNIVIFHAGTIKEDNKIYTAGGRVLGVTSILGKNDLKKAKAITYSALEKVKFNGVYFRKDIGDKAINR